MSVSMKDFKCEVITAISPKELVFKVNNFLEDVNDNTGLKARIEGGICIDTLTHGNDPYYQTVVLMSLSNDPVLEKIGEKLDSIIHELKYSNIN